MHRPIDCGSPVRRAGWMLVLHYCWMQCRTYDWRAARLQVGRLFFGSPQLRDGQPPRVEEAATHVTMFVLLWLQETREREIENTYDMICTSSQSPSTLRDAQNAMASLSRHTIHATGWFILWALASGSTSTSPSSSTNTNLENERTERVALPSRFITRKSPYGSAVPYGTLFAS